MPGNSTKQQSPRLVVVIVLIALFAMGALLFFFIVNNRQYAQQNPSSMHLRQSLQEVVDALSLKPFGNGSTSPSEEKVKDMPVYYVATGLIAQPEDTARLSVVNEVQRHGWTVKSQGSKDTFLGWEMIATRDSMVLRVYAGKEARGVPDSPYKAQEGYTYVQASVAGRNSGPGWTEV